MATRRKKRRKKKTPETAAEPPEPRKTLLPSWSPAVVILAAVLVFYWTPLTSSGASIQWDAIDVHYSSQKYFAESLRESELPHWTPYIFSGFPFLADPQVGAWYPLNWPFFLAGITPRVIQLEIFLHSLIACFGAWLLGRRVLDNSWAAAVSALCYGLGGFFAGHASHVGMVQTAAWLPWLLLVFLRATEPNGLRRLPVAGLVGGVMLLAGHFQTSLYAFSALGLVAAFEAMREPRRWARPVLIFASTALVGGLLAAVQILPAQELVGQSIRADLDMSGSSEGALPPAALTTLFFPNALGALSGDYQGPSDVTQYYLYGGFLLLPLAVWGLWNSRVRPFALSLTVPALWYALGPPFGLARVLGSLPGFGQVRAPVHAWFVVSLGLAVLCGAGVMALQHKLGQRYAAPLVAIVFLLDLAYWNSMANPLTYARANFEQAYAPAARMLREKVAPLLKPQTRLHAPAPVPAFGSLNHPLDEKIEATYGYNPLQLSRYQKYLEAAKTNAKLLKGLSASRIVNIEANRVDPIEGPLPAAIFPARLMPAADRRTSAEMLSNLDPSQATITEGAPSGLETDPIATVLDFGAARQSYSIRYQASTETVLRLAVPYFPGWIATLEDRTRLTIIPADHAFMGVVVPAGGHTLSVAFQSNYFWIGAGLSLATLLLVGAGVIFLRFRLKFSPTARAWASRPAARGKSAAAHPEPRA